MWRFLDVFNYLRVLKLAEPKVGKLCISHGINDNGKLSALRLMLLFLCPIVFSTKENLLYLYTLCVERMEKVETEESSISANSDLQRQIERVVHNVACMYHQFPVSCPQVPPLFLLGVGILRLLGHVTHRDRRDTEMRLFGISSARARNGDIPKFKSKYFTDDFSNPSVLYLDARVTALFVDDLDDNYAILPPSHALETWLSDALKSIDGSRAAATHTQDLSCRVFPCSDDESQSLMRLSTRFQFRFFAVFCHLKMICFPGKVQYAS
eukprot:ANDGO_01914.mRNA.1 hypothetical protein